jgi:FixJ family two-component response regulator
MKQWSEVRYAQKHNGEQLKHRKMWTDEMINVLYDLFPTTQNRDIAEQLGVSEYAVRTKARDCGLHKAKSYIHAIRAQQADAVNAKRRNKQLKEEDE